MSHSGNSWDVVTVEASYFDCLDALLEQSKDFNLYIPSSTEYILLLDFKLVFQRYFKVLSIIWTIMEINLLTCKKSVVYHLRRGYLKIVVGFVVLRSLVWFRVISWQSIEVSSLFTFSILFLISSFRCLKQWLILIFRRLVLLLGLLRLLLYCPFSVSFDFNFNVICRKNFRVSFSEITFLIGDHSDFIVKFINVLITSLKQWQNLILYLL